MYVIIYVFYFTKNYLRTILELSKLSIDIRTLFVSDNTIPGDMININLTFFKLQNLLKGLFYP